MGLFKKASTYALMLGLSTATVNSVAADGVSKDRVFGTRIENISNLSDVNVNFEPYNGVLLERQMMLQGVRMDLFEVFHMSGDYYEIVKTILGQAKDKVELLQYIADEGAVGAKEVAALTNMMAKQYVSKEDLRRGAAKEQAIIKENSRVVRRMDQAIGFNVEEAYDPTNDEWAKKALESRDSKRDAPKSSATAEQRIEQLKKLQLVQPESVKEIQEKIDEIKGTGIPGE